MAQIIAERLIWAVETLAVAPSDRLLEIGCGHGTAVSLICGKLADGNITAIDQSEKMIAAAEKKNRDHIAAGKAIFHTAALDKADLSPVGFNKIFAVNVNLFWMQPARELAIIKALLLPGGAVYLFNQPPSASKINNIADKTAQNLLDAGFSIKQVIIEELNPVPAVCAIAQLKSESQQ